MAKFSIIATILWLLSLSNICYGFSKQKLSPEEKTTLIGDYRELEVSKSAISWRVFAKTKATEICTEIDGLDDCITKPTYSNEIKKFDQKEVTLMGYMFPLSQGPKQTNFLLGPYPLSCPFHYHVGPEQIVEVKLKKGIKFSYDPVTIKGKLKLKFNRNTGIFYFLEN